VCSNGFTGVANRGQIDLAQCADIRLSQIEDITN